jgi:hypothetical protein
MFAIEPQIYPIWFAQILILMYMNWNGELHGSTFVSILWLGVQIQRGASVEESAQCSQMSLERFQVLPHILGMSLTSGAAYLS